MRRLNFRLCIAVMASLILVSGSLFFVRDRLWSAGETSEQPRLSPTGALLLEPSESEDPLSLLETEQPEERSEWFISQRAYPFDSVSAEARREAWESVLQHRQALDGSLSPAASNVWQQIGPSPTNSAYNSAWGVTSGRINSVAVSPANSQIILIGSSTGGIWRSTSGGSNFAPVSDDQVDLAVGSISFSKSDPQIVYAGMGDTKLGYLGSGVLKSTNGGASWRRASNSSLPSPGLIARIEVDPSNSSRVYVAQFSRLAGVETQASGFYVSSDGGVNWTKTFTGWTRDVVIHPTNRQTVFLCAASRETGDEVQPAGLYRSTDSGQTWSVILAAPFDPRRTRDFRVAVSAADPQKIYAYLGGFNGADFRVKLMASADGGGTWSVRNAEGLDWAAFGYNTYIHADPANANRIFVGTRDIYRSDDGGETWTNITRNFSPFGVILDYTPWLANTHPDQHGFAFAPSNPSVIYIGNDGGISKSTDGGNRFQSLNSSLSLTQFIGITLHPTDPAISYGGTQDNGTQRRLNGTSQWLEFASGDGGRSVLSVTRPDIVFTTYIRGSIFRFSENGTVFDRQVAFSSSFGEGGRISFYAPFVGNGVDDTLYFGTWRLFISTDMGGDWTAPGGETDLTKGFTAKGADVLTAIAVARSNTRIIYTGSAQGRAMASTDGGATWMDITTGLPDRNITAIAIDRDNPAVAYLTVSGYGSGHVFKTTDRGATWAGASAGLPDIPANAILIDPGASNRLYLGTDIGVFRSTDGGASWQSFNSGMPPVVVTAFAAQESGLIQASTYGRGAYEIMAGVSRPAISSVEFNKKKMTINGSRFSGSPSVIINDIDRTSYVKTVSDTTIRLKAKPKKIGLIEGDNTIRVVNEDGGSTVFVFRYQG